jgi:hypothetical protein
MSESQQYFLRTLGPPALLGPDGTEVPLDDQVLAFVVLLRFERPDRGQRFSQFLQEIARKLHPRTRNASNLAHAYAKRLRDRLPQGRVGHGKTVAWIQALCPRGRTPHRHPVAGFLSWSLKPMRPPSAPPRRRPRRVGVRPFVRRSTDTTAPSYVAARGCGSGEDALSLVRSGFPPRAAPDRDPLETTPRIPRRVDPSAPRTTRCGARLSPRGPGRARAAAPPPARRVRAEPGASPSPPPSVLEFPP